MPDSSQPVATPRVVVTSIVRHAGTNERSGLLRVIDIERQRVLLQTTVPESAHRATDANPRGGTRGARGIGVHGDRLVVANSERLFVIDPSWRVVNEITHPWTSAIHDVYAERAGIWITCTNCDLLMKVSWEGQILDSWSWRSDRRLVRALGFHSVPRFRPNVDYREPRAMRGGAYNIVHMNGVSRGRQGLLLSFGRVLSPAMLRKRRVDAYLGRAATKLGIPPRRERPREESPFVQGQGIAGSSFAIVRLGDAETASRQARIVLRQNGVNVPNHNVFETPDGKLVFNDSNRGALVLRDPGPGAVEAAVPTPGSARSFLRGLAVLPDGTFLVGDQAPPAVHRIDLTAGRVVSSFPFEGPEHESVYGVAVLPDAFEEPGDVDLSRTPR